VRLIEKAFADAKNDLTKNWKEFAGDASNPLIKECYAAVDGLGDPELIDDGDKPWCSCYVNKKVQNGGGRGTRSAAARSWLQWGKILEEPEIGCIAVKKRWRSNWMGHVGFVYEIGPTYIVLLGGNQDNRVCLQRYPRKEFIGFRTSKD